MKYKSWHELLMSNDPLDLIISRAVTCLSDELKHPYPAQVYEALKEEAFRLHKNTLSPAA